MQNHNDEENGFKVTLKYRDGSPDKIIDLEMPMEEFQKLSIEEQEEFISASQKVTAALLEAYKIYKETS